MAERTYTQVVFTGMMIGAIAVTTNVNGPSQSTVTMTQPIASDALIISYAEFHVDRSRGAVRALNGEIPLFTKGPT